MSTRHLTGDELDRALAGYELDREGEEHLRSCLMCRRRQDGLMAVLTAARVGDPDEGVRARLRASALESWGRQSRTDHAWWWWAAAAALLVIALVAAFWRPGSVPQADLNTEAVLNEVDRVLARDPLEAMASEEVLEVVVPETEGAQPPSVS